MSLLSVYVDHQTRSRSRSELPRWLHERQLSPAGTAGADPEGRGGRGDVMTVGE